MALIMTRRQLLSNALVMTVTSSCPTEPKSHEARVFRLLAGSKNLASDLQKTISQLPKSNVRLVFSQGVWEFVDRTGVIILFNRFDGLEIDGDGSHFQFCGVARPFYFDNCKRIVLKNFSIGWGRPPHTDGHITNVSDEGRSITFEGGDCVNMPYETICSVSEYDVVSGLPKHDAFETYQKTVVSNAGDGRMQFRLKDRTPLSVGDYIVVRHALDNHVIHFWECDDIAVSNISVYAGAGMAYVFDYCNKVSLSSSKVLSKGSGILSVNEDACHMNSCSGALAVTDCEFSNMGDDGVNIHSKYYRVNRIGKSNGLVVEATKRIFGAIQDKFLLFDLAWKICGLLLVDKVSFSEGRLVITANYPLPATFPDAGYIEYFNETGSCRVCGNIITRNRGRGVIVHRNATVRLNVLGDHSAQALLCGVDNGLEGPIVQNVAVDSNAISCSAGHKSRVAAIDINDSFNPSKATNGSRPLAVKVSVTNNFVEWAGQPLKCRNVDDLRVTGNLMSAPADTHLRINITDCRNVLIDGNAAYGKRLGSIETKDCVNVNKISNLGFDN